MRPSLKALTWAWALPALVSSLAIPPPPGPPGHEDSAETGATNPIVELDLQSTQAKATFSIPCPGCLSQDSNPRDDEALTFSFEAFSSETPCGISNITLNGRYLAQEWTGQHAQGEGSFEGVPDLERNEWFRTHDLDLSWGSTCLDGPSSKDEAPSNAEDAAQVLTVNIKAIDGKPIPQSSGFTISFKQLSPPELLRLELFPDRTAGDLQFSDAWRNPPAHLRLGEVAVEETQLQFPSIEDEIRELKLLQQKAKELRNQIREKKQRIRAHLHHDALSLKEELKQCDNLKCIVKTLARKAHGAVRIIYIRLRPHHHRPHPMGKSNDPYHAVWQTHSLPSQVHTTCNGNCTETPPPPPPSEGHPPPEGPSPPPHHAPHHGPPHHGSHHGHHGPHHPHRNPLLKALSILASALGLTTLLVFLHRHCCTLRARTDRRAAREERRTARQYRRAARRQAWASWWRRNLDRRRIADYEEKRALINEQESILEAAMQEEIRQFRAAHGVVNSIVQAEEGRSAMSSLQHEQLHRQRRVGMQANPHPAFTPAELPVVGSEPLSRTSSLPDYRSEAGSTEPPAYEDEEDSSDVVVDGFREYTPSTTTEWTPESSVVDVSPRPSRETMRVPGEEYVQKN